MTYIFGAFGLGILLALAELPAFADGKTVYEAKCSMCHAAGVSGAPRLGNKVQWATRIRRGIDALVISTIEGVGDMPARAGQNVNDTDIKAAIEYMIRKSK